MRLSPTISLVVLAAAASMPAQTSQIQLPGFGSTFSSSLTRGFYFQAPVAFDIVAAGVPDESGQGTQNIELYVWGSAVGGPPAFNATYTPQVSELRFSTYGAPVGGLPVIFSSRIAVQAGEWVSVLGACGTTTMANSYGTPSGPFASSVLGQPVTLERCGTQFNINSTPGPNPMWSESAGPIGRVELWITPPGGTVVFPPELVAVAEQVPLTGTLGTEGGSFTTGDFLRWNFNDPSNNSGGLLIWNTVNFGTGGSPPIGSTAQIPGLVQVWPGSTPPGVADVIGPTSIGAADTVAPIPPGLFANGDRIRFQGIVLDPRVQTATTLPINPTANTIEFRFTDCTFLEDFDSLTSGAGVYPMGWSNGGGVAEWSVDSGGTPSGATGPSAAVSGSNYYYCETSSPRTNGDTFIVNTGPFASGSLANGMLSFELSRVGATIGTLEVRMDDGSGAYATLLATYTGADPSGLEWTSEQLMLPMPLPANVSFQFNYAQGSSFTGDIAIDDVCVN